MKVGLNTDVRTYALSGNHYTWALARQLVFVSYFQEVLVVTFKFRRDGDSGYVRCCGTSERGLAWISGSATPEEDDVYGDEPGDEAVVVVYLGYTEWEESVDYVGGVEGDVWVGV